MKQLLVDISVIIDYLRQKDKEHSLYFRVLDHDFYISIITHTELYSGQSVWQKKRALEELEIVFSDVTVFPLTVEISKMAGNIRALYGIELIDAIIAATALVHDLELVTFNTKDFEKITDLVLFTQ